MSRDRAAYMREYRARTGAGVMDAIKAEKRAAEDELHDRVAELEEEVRHLKAELAKRTPRDTGNVLDSRGIAPGAFNTRPFTPVPKVKK